MLCLGLEPGAARWLAQTDPLSYGGRPSFQNIFETNFSQKLGDLSGFES